MRWVNYFFILVFILSAALQYNDPDPYVWMPLYLYGAFLCWYSLRGHYRPVLFLPPITVYCIYALLLIFEPEGVLSWISQHEAENIMQSMKAEKPWIESTREFFGLILLLLAAGLNVAWLKGRERMVGV